ncbi:MAG: transglycosylase SLT domain-containing protein [Myxococcota bacterium]
MLTLLALLALPASAALPTDLRAAVATGDCAMVVQGTAGLQSSEAQLVRGRCQLRMGDPTAAIASLTQVTDDVLDDVAALHLAEAHLELEQHEQATQALNGATLSGPAGLQLRLLRGRALIAQGRSLDARPDLRLLLKTSVGDEARFYLAIGARDRGDKGPALVTFRRVWASSTRGPWSAMAAAELATLGHPVPFVGTAEERTLMLDRIAALDKAHRYDESLKLRLALHSVEPMGPMTLARATFKARQYTASVAHYRKALGAANLATGGPSDLFQYALATSRTGDYPTAALIYKRLVNQHARSKKADTASYKLGYLHVDRGEWAPATEALTQHIKAYPASKHLDEAYWWMGWGAFVQGEYDEAKGHWANLASKRPRSSLVAGSKYWTARIHGLNGDKGAESNAMTRVLKSYPTSGYAWFAAERIGARNAVQPAAEPPDWPEGFAQPEVFARYQTLVGAGLEDLAREELKGLIPAAKTSGREARLALAWALIDAGAYRDGQSLARPYCVSPWKGGDPVAQQACYPRPAQAVVRATAERFQVPEVVPYGIMTTESALDPTVVSIAGARGLMQLMPKEAEGLHNTLYEGRPYHPDMLFSAPYNASLGVAELGTKQELLGDVLEGPDIVAAIAAYNGGENAVKRWADGLGGHPDFDQFTEQIGYTETRRYVKKVLGTVMAYRYVYGDP